MTPKPPDLEIDVDGPIHGRRWRAWRFDGPMPPSIRRLERVTLYSFCALFAFCLSTLLWASPTQTDDCSFPLKIRLFIVSAVVYLPRWGAWILGVGFGVLLALFCTVLLLFRKHRRELTEVTWEVPDPEAPTEKPVEPEEYWGRGTL